VWGKPLSPAGGGRGWISPVGGIAGGGVVSGNTQGNGN